MKNTLGSFTALAFATATLSAAASSAPAQLSIYNGLNRAVIVEVAGDKHPLAVHSSTALAVKPGKLKIVTRTTQGEEIEKFEERVEKGARGYAYNVAGGAALIGWVAIYTEDPGAQVPSTPFGNTRWMATSHDDVFVDPPPQQPTGTRRNGLKGYSDDSPFAVVGAMPQGSNGEDMIKVHARWDDTASRHGQIWMNMAERFDWWPAVLAERIARDPENIPLRRMEQDADPARKPAVCKAQTKLSESHPDSADYRYLAVRCMEDGPVNKAAFVAALARFPDHGWLQFAVGMDYAGSRRYLEAIPLLDSAGRRIPGLREHTLVEVHRMERLLAATLPSGKAPPSVVDISLSTYLQMMADIDGGKVPEPHWAHTYILLNRGELARAVEHSAYTPELATRMVRLVGASDGASKAQIEAALALPPADGNNGMDVFFAAALALRAGKDPQPLYDAVTEKDWRDSDWTKMMIAFLAALKAGEDPAKAEARLVTLGSATAGAGYAAGVVLLGERAPRAWRANAKTLLYAMERPYFR